MSISRPDPSTPSCPEWCTLPFPHHPWDHLVRGREVRGHQGPRFGPYVWTGSFEYADHAGVHHYDLCLDPAVETEVRTPEQARALAADLIAAAAWVEEREEERAS